MIVRIGAIFFVNSMIDKGTQFYEYIDKKEMQATVEFVMYPALLLTTVNWKLEFCITLPITIIAMSYTT